jgi:hypothetical protein
MRDTAEGPPPRHVTYLEKLTEELISILRTGHALTTGRARMAEIGNSLNELGLNAMRQVAADIRSRFPGGEGGANGWHPAEIDYAWDGIGDWR